MNKKTQISYVLLFVISVVGVILLLFVFHWFSPGQNVIQSAKNEGATTSEEAYIVPSKYKNIEVQTVEEKSGDGRYLLHASWPVTENKTINEALNNFAQAYIADYRQSVSASQAMQKKMSAESGYDPRTLHADYNLHFDVNFANEEYLAFTFTKYTNTGNTGEDIVRTKIYDRKTGQEIPFSDLFADTDYLKTLSKLSREQLYQKVAKERNATDFDSPAARSRWLEDFKQDFIDPGTTPEPKNFHSLFISEDGFLVINFDKYQVAPGYWGVVTVKIPLTKINDMFTPAVKELFDLQTTTNTSSPQPGSTISSSQNGNNVSQSVTTDCSIKKCVALTFDDGPSVYTKKLLKILTTNGVPATFFVLGVNAKVQQQTILDLAKAGMTIGNHSWDHKDLTKLSQADIKDEIKNTADLIEAITGTRPTLVRPPYGALNNQVRQVIASGGNQIVLWNVDPEDWKYRDTAHNEKAVLSHVKRNSIILLHDIYDPSVQAVPTIIETLKGKGFTFVPVTDLNL